MVVILKMLKVLWKMRKTFKKQIPTKCILSFLRLKKIINTKLWIKKGDSVENKSQLVKRLNFCKLSNTAVIPNRATSGSAGLDLCADVTEELVLAPGQRCKVPCGIAISLPSSEYAAFIFARSGLAIKHGIALSNGVGVIDSDYRGEICVGLYNSGSEAYTIKPGERIAQMVIMKVENFVPFQVESLDETERGKGGFGSTGR